MKRYLILLCLICSFVNVNFAQTPASKIPKTAKKTKAYAKDKATTYPAPYDYLSNKKYKGVQKSSTYLTMRDGVKIAVDIYLPKNLQKGEKIPVLVRQTRYWRAPQINFPFSLLTNGLVGRMGEMIRDFIESGYAIVNVDVRGSGASFGSRLHPWTADEIQDGYEILDWIVKQEWSDGNIGSLGVSYGGTAAEFLASTKHPNLKAVALMFSLFDVYEDNAFPGGIHHDWFTEIWGEANDRMDNNLLPLNYQKMSWLIGGVSTVATKGKQQLLQAAIKDHQNNKNVHEGSLTVDFRDDAPTNIPIQSVDVFSPHKYLKAIDESGVAVYSYSGWMDGAYQNAAIKRHINLNNPDNKLIIGPWEHGGAYQISPYGKTYADFNHVAELLKFFDFHLKNKQNGLDREAAVHYYTMGEEQWKKSAVWPPEGAKQDTLYFSSYFGLQANIDEVEGQAEVSVQHDTGTGHQSRWKSLNGKIETAQMYYDWEERSKNMLSFSTAALEEGLEVTGHPLFEIYTSFDKTDGQIFVYLQDVDEDGKVHYVTEGLLRATHRGTTEIPLYKEIGPARTHTRGEAAPLKAGEVVFLQADMIPTSYLFQKGHRIKISIAGSDIDHFEQLHPEGYNFQVHYGAAYPSRVVLPIYE